MSPRSRTAVVASAALIAAMAFASPASAAPADDYDLDFPAGLACEDIDLSIDVNVVGKPPRDFYDRNGVLDPNHRCRPGE